MEAVTIFGDRLRAQNKYPDKEQVKNRFEDPGPFDSGIFYLLDANIFLILYKIKVGSSPWSYLTDYPSRVKLPIFYFLNQIDSMK